MKTSSNEIEGTRPRYEAYANYNLANHAIYWGLGHESFLNQLDWFIFSKYNPSTFGMPNILKVNSQGCASHIFLATHNYYQNSIWIGSHVAFEIMRELGYM